MSDLREAAKLALIALENGTSPNLWLSTKENLRQALAQPEQEPVALLHISPNYKCQTTFLKPKKQEHTYPLNDTFETIPVYAVPPKREWVGLTDEEIDTWNIVGHESLREFVRAIEAKLKEKNGG